jgi:hypothetical protein
VQHVYFGTPFIYLGIGTEIHANGDIF